MDLREHFKEEGRQEGLQKGMKRGMQKGVQQGMQKGRQEGMQEGVQQGIQKRDEIVLNMLKKKLDASLISEVTGLSEEEIRKIQNGS